MDIMSVMQSYIKEKDLKLQLHIACILIILHHPFIVKINYTALEQKNIILKKDYIRGPVKISNESALALLEANQHMLIVPAKIQLLLSKQIYINLFKCLQ